MTEFLHEHHDFNELLMLVTDQQGIAPSLVEKDYWIMHCLWGLQAQGFTFELKGGMTVMTGRNHDRPAHIASRRAHYEALANRITIPGIESVQRYLCEPDTGSAVQKSPVSEWKQGFIRP